MSLQEFRETHGSVEDWSPEDFEHYLEACAEQATEETGPETGGRS